MHAKLTLLPTLAAGPKRRFVSTSAIALTIGLFVAVPADATTYELDEGTPQVFGAIEHYTTSYEDTFTDIARRYSLGWEEVIRVNPGIDPWVPGAGKDLLIPNRRILPSGPHEGIVVNLPEHRLYYFPKRKKGEKPIVITYAVSIGKMDWRTPLGETRIVNKQKNPNWYPPDSVRKEHAERGEPLPAVVKSGPDNPLGDYAMRLAITPGAYLIHGTNNPLAVGMAVTHGCVRMYPEDIAALFPIVPMGTKVRFVNEPVKVAFIGGELLLEVHPPVNAEGQTIEPDLEMFSHLLDQALGPTTAAVHWEFARETMQLANGLPTVVGLEADLNPPTDQSAPAVAGTVDAQGNPVAAAGVAGTVDAQGNPVAAPAVDAQGNPAAVSQLPQPSSVASLPSQGSGPPLPATPPATPPPSGALPTPDPAHPAPTSSSGAQTFGAGDPESATPTAPGQNAPTSAVPPATAPGPVNPSPGSSAPPPRN